MKSIFILMLFSHTILYAQNFGLRIALTTVTLTGNNDAYDFDFIDSFSPGYKLGFLGSFELSDIITLQPEFSYGTYATKQSIDDQNSILYELEQVHQTISFDLNFDVKLPDSWSLVFGMGLDYLLFKKYRINNVDDFYNVNNFLNHDDLLDPFTNIKLCYTINKSIVMALEYRHLLDNWRLADLNNFNQLMISDHRTIKAHIINFSTGVLF